jgi:transposase InsO family protein
MMSDQDQTFEQDHLGTHSGVHDHHQKSTPYHPQANGMVEAFNNILEHALTKVCNVHHDIGISGSPQFYGHIEQPVNGLMKHTPFRLVYDKEVVMSTQIYCS